MIGHRIEVLNEPVENPQVFGIRTDFYILHAIQKTEIKLKFELIFTS